MVSYLFKKFGSNGSVFFCGISDTYYQCLINVQRGLIEINMIFLMVKFFSVYKPNKFFSFNDPEVVRVKQAHKQKNTPKL
jgi:hypothetical protein